MMPYDTPLDIARNFLEKLMEDEGLRAEVEGKQPEEVAQIAAEHGFGAGADILMDVLDEYKRRTCAEPAELDPEQLDAVVGGLGGDDANDGHEMGCIMWWYTSIYDMRKHGADGHCTNRYF